MRTRRPCGRCIFTVLMNESCSIIRQLMSQCYGPSSDVILIVVSRDRVPNVDVVVACSGVRLNCGVQWSSAELWCAVEFG